MQPVLKVKLKESLTVAHHLFYKQYKSNSDKETNDLNARTLFVTNIPGYFTANGLKNAFNYFGKVEHVLLYPKATTTPFKTLNKKETNTSLYFKDDEESDEDDEKEGSGFKVAYIVFDQVQCVEKAISKPLVDKERTLVNGKDNPIKTGMRSMFF